MSEPNRLQINWVTSAGGALGAVSSAVVLSSLGAAGTLVGAALGSLCITVGGAVYSHYLTLTKDRVAAQAGRRSGRGAQEAPADAEGAARPEQPEEPQRNQHGSHAVRVDEERSVGEVARGLPWKRIVAISGALFALAMAVIVSFELLTGRAVSTFTGGTSNTNVGTSIPGWSGTGQESLDMELDDEPLPGDVQDGDVPQEQEQAPDDAPEEQAPQPEAPQEDAPEQQPAPEDPAP